MRNIRRNEEESQKFARALRKNMTEAEHRLWSFIRKKQLDGYRFRRQRPIGVYIADFVCVAEKFIIEIDGATHSSQEEVLHDKRRTQYLKNKGWKVVRYTNEDVYKHSDDVLNDIMAQLRGLKVEQAY